MRINGNYFDRLIYTILPLFGCITGLLYVVHPHKSVPISFGITMFGYWLMDTLTLAVKRPKTVIVRNGDLWVGKDLVDPHTIESITAISIMRFRWSSELVELQIAEVGKITMIDRPAIFHQFGEKSKSVDLLVANFPFLKEKVAPRRYV